MTGRILLTGGAGYIGSHTYVALCQAGYEVVILDNFSNAREDVLERLEILTDATVTCHKADILDPDALRSVFAAHAFDAVVHFAARKAVGESMRLPLEYFRSNCTGLLNLLDAMQAAGVHRLVFSSSATVYGTPDKLPIDETAPTRPDNTYGATKLIGEQILQRVAQSDPKWAFGILRYFNPVGAHRSGLIGEDPQDIPNNLMPFIAKVATGELPALNVFGNDYDTHDGTGVRDYIHVEDLADGHVLSLGALLATDEGHLVNLGTGRPYSVMEMLRSYSAACGRELPHVLAPRRPGDIAIYYADPSKAKRTLGFSAERGLDEMCSSSWNWVSRRRNA